jgi:hypothetical protein
MLDLLDEVDGRLTGVLIRWPDAFDIVWPIQKHVRFALFNDKQVDLKEYLEKTRGRLTAAMVNYPEMQEYFTPLTEKIEKELGVNESRATARRAANGS